MSTLLKNSTAKNSMTESDCSVISDYFETVKTCKHFPLKSAIIKDWQAVSCKEDKHKSVLLLALKGSQIAMDNMYLQEEVLEPVTTNYAVSDDINSCLNVLVKQDRRITTDGMIQSKALLIEALTEDFSKVQPKLQEEDLHDLRLLSGLEDSKTKAQGTTKTSAEITESKRYISGDPEMLLKLDWFMGPKPVLEKEYTTNDGYDIMIISSTPAKKNKKPGSLYKPVIKNIALRYLTRVNFIIKTVNKERIIESRVKLRSIITSIEKEEGYEATVDRKTMEKIYAMLLEEGYLKAYKIVMKSDGMTHRLHLMCSLDVTPEDSEFISVIEHAKLTRFHSEQKLVTIANIKGIPSEKDIEHSVSELKELNSIVPTAYKYSCFMGKEYGYAQSL